jgi:hypothetical protein
MTRVFLIFLVLTGCSTHTSSPRERIVISGTQPVIIEQDYRNEDGNVRYISKIEIYGGKK